MPSAPRRGGVRPIFATASVSAVSMLHRISHRDSNPEDRDPFRGDRSGGRVRNGAITAPFNDSRLSCDLETAPNHVSWTIRDRVLPLDFRRNNAASAVPARRHLKNRFRPAPFLVSGQVAGSRFSPALGADDIPKSVICSKRRERCSSSVDVELFRGGGLTAMAGSQAGVGLAESGRDPCRFLKILRFDCPPPKVAVGWRGERESPPAFCVDAIERHSRPGNLTGEAPDSAFADQVDHRRASGEGLCSERVSEIPTRRGWRTRPKGGLRQGFRWPCRDSIGEGLSRRGHKPISAPCSETRSRPQAAEPQGSCFYRSTSLGSALQSTR